MPWYVWLIIGVFVGANIGAVIMGLLIRSAAIRNESFSGFRQPHRFSIFN